MYCVRFASNNASDDTFYVPYILYSICETKSQEQNERKKFC